jgi:tripartite-type tricarboxylate transporter receptor subunit TctC
MFPGLGISNWHGIFAPAGMARQLQDRLALDIRQALAAPLLSKRFSELGFDPASASTEEFRQIILRDYEGWGALIRKNNIKAE